MRASRPVIATRIGEPFAIARDTDRLAPSDRRALPWLGAVGGDDPIDRGRQERAFGDVLPQQQERPEAVSQVRTTAPEMPNNNSCIWWSYGDPRSGRWVKALFDSGVGRQRHCLSRLSRDLPRAQNRGRSPCRRSARGQVIMRPASRKACGAGRTTCRCRQQTVRAQSGDIDPLPGRGTPSGPKPSTQGQRVRQAPAAGRSFHFPKLGLRSIHGCQPPLDAGHRSYT